MMNVHLELLTYLFVSVLGELHYLIWVPFWLKVDIHASKNRITLPPQTLNWGSYGILILGISFTYVSQGDASDHPRNLH